MLFPEIENPSVGCYLVKHLVAERAQEDVIPHATMVGALC